jgi:hypothetical protein
MGPAIPWYGHLGDESKEKAMTKHRYVSTCFWDDAYIMRLDPSEKLLFMYLLTNPLTNISGVYQVTVKRIAFDTGFDQDVVTHILERFECDGKCIYRDGWVAMHNWLKHQNPSSKVLTGISALLKEAPEDLANYVQGYGIDTQSHLNPNSNSNFNESTQKMSTSSAPAHLDASVPQVAALISKFHKEAREKLEQEASARLGNPKKKIFYDYDEKVWRGITQADIDFWQDDFDGLEIISELKKMKAWLDSNPKKKDFKRFISGWLLRGQGRSTTFARGKK